MLAIRKTKMKVGLKNKRSINAQPRLVPRPYFFPWKLPFVGLWALERALGEPLEMPLGDPKALLRASFSLKEGEVLGRGTLPLTVRLLWSLANAPEHRRLLTGPGVNQKDKVWSGFAGRAAREGGGYQ